MKIKSPRIIYFLDGPELTADDKQNVRKLGGNVVFRNAHFAKNESSIEASDGVAGAIPDAYKEQPDGYVVVAKFDEAENGPTVPVPPHAFRPAIDEALLGSSVQPATFTVNGSVIQLGTVVAEAHKRSGLTVGDWNKQADEAREFAIAAVVTEWVGQPTAASSVGTPSVPPAPPAQDGGWTTHTPPAIPPVNQA